MVAVKVGGKDSRSSASLEVRCRESPAPRRPRPHRAAPGGGPGRGAGAGSRHTHAERARAQLPGDYKGKAVCVPASSVCSFSSTCIVPSGRWSDLSRQNGEADREQGMRQARARRAAPVAGEGAGREVGRPPLRIPEEGDAAARPGAAGSPGLGALWAPEHALGDGSPLEGRVGVPSELGEMHARVECTGGPSLRFLHHPCLGTLAWGQGVYSWPPMYPESRPGRGMEGSLENTAVAGRHTLPGEWRDPHALVGWASIGADPGRRPPAASTSAVPHTRRGLYPRKEGGSGPETPLPFLGGLIRAPKPQGLRCPHGSEVRAAPSGLLLLRRGACFRQRWLWHDSVPRAGPRDLRCPARLCDSPTVGGSRWSQECPWYPDGGAILLGCPRQKSYCETDTLPPGKLESLT